MTVSLESMAKILKLLAECIGFFNLAIPIVIFLFVRFSKKWQRLKEMWGSITNHPALAKQIDEIHKEIRTNGGGSIKDAVNELRQSFALENARWKIVTEHLDIIAWESDVNGKTTWVSNSMCRLLGRQSEELLGMNWRSIIWEDDREHVLEAWDDATSRKISFYLTYSWRHKNGTKIPVLAESHIIKNYKNECVGFLCIGKIPVES